MNKEFAHTVFIRGLEINACHGVHDFEKTQPQLFVIDARLNIGYSPEVVKDNLEGTVSYSDACKVIEKTVLNNTFNLIEKLAAECAYSLLNEFSLIAGVEITVKKPEAPVKYKLDTVGVNFSAQRVKAYLSLGSSQGDRKKYLYSALCALNDVRGVKVLKISSFIENAPYGGVAENMFLNCAAEIETYLSPFVLLDEIHVIEERFGRVRGKRWDDRTLDIDIIFYGGHVIEDERLTVPHADYINRDFVLIPLKEIAPDFLCPLLNKRVKDL